MYKMEQIYVRSISMAVIIINLTTQSFAESKNLTFSKQIAFHYLPISLTTIGSFFKAYFIVL